ncbi:MAG: hypothetical protein U9N78_08185 [Actinomycetota bacterium]|nr:hypothetical protein [Actinomycetota bacterium]
MATSVVGYGPAGTDLVFMPRSNGWRHDGANCLVDAQDAGRRITLSRLLLEPLDLESMSSELIEDTEVLIDDVGSDGVRAVALVDATWGLSIESRGIEREELVDAIRSIPVVGLKPAFDTGVGEPIRGRVPASGLAGWLESRQPVEFSEGSDLVPLAEPRRRHHDVVLVAGRLARSGRALAVLDARVNPLSSLAVIVPAGRLRDYRGIPLVSSWDEESSRADVMWAQRDRFWHLMSADDLEGLVELAARICDRVVAIP